MISGNIKVLLVEDNSGDVLFTQTILNNSELCREKKIAFEINFCTSLHETREYLKSNYVDIILLDLNLPDSWGLDTFQSLRHMFPDIPIIILSGINDENISLHAIQNGAHDYIIKGEFDDIKLINAILSSLEQIKSDPAQLA